MAVRRASPGHYPGGAGFLARATSRVRRHGGHHIDVGGKNPGSTTANTTEIFQEGLQLPPLKYYEAGSKNTAVEAIIRQNVRLPDVVSHDLECQMAVNARASQALLELCRKYGPDVLEASFARAIASSERLMRAEIERIPRRGVQL